MNNLLRKIQECVWYQDEISTEEHRPVGPLQSGTTVIDKLNYPNIINKKQWKSLEKEGKIKGINNSYNKEVFPLRQL